MSTFTRPENALKKAEELIAVGQKETALQTLHDVITSKRHRTWSKTLESIMLKYVELCVEMRKGKVAKEGLHQYKLVCQQVNVSSLELVIKHFLALVEENAKEAQSKAEKLTLDIEDLDEEESAESIMLTAISGEATKDRTDREIVTPWLRFLWETYRTILEILRNNAKMEGVYHQTAEQAFSFCLRYQRKNEFRRLSDILRLHLANYSKYPNQPQNINLSVPETLQIHLDTRFSQLNVATELELWQEAFRSIEDIHSLIALSGRPAKPQMMATYFQKLAQIFWVSNNYTFHAYALYKYFAVARNVRNFTPEETRTVASTVLLSALSIPVADPKAPDDQYFEFDVQKEKNLRFCTLLTITSVPKREALLQDLIVTKKINNLVVPGLPDLYDLLENKFQPLALGAKMQEKFDLLNANPALAQYVKPLQRLTFLRATQQLGTVYESMTIPDFLRIIKFMPLHEAEKNLVDLVKRKIVAVRIDHQNGALHFGNKQEQLRGQLITLAKDLKEVVKLINPEDLGQKQQKEKEKRAALIQLAKAEAEDRTWSYNRKFIIEMKKQEAEKRMKQEQDRQNEIKQKIAAEAAAALADRIEHERLEREKKLKEEQDNKKKLEDLQKQITLQGLAAPAAAEDITDVYIEKQLALLAKQKEAAEKKLQSVGKRLLYLERAKREVEKPLLQAAYEKKKAEDTKFFEDNARQQAELAQQQHTLQVAEKKRLSRMQADRAAFEERIMSRRRADYEVRKAEQDKKLAEIKVKLEEDKKRKQQEAEERRAEEEKIRKAKDEEDKKRREAEDLRRQEVEAQRKKQDDLIEKQRQREAEVMAKQRKEDEDRREKEKQARETARPPARGEPEPWRRPGAGRDDRDRPPPPRDDRDRPPPSRDEREPEPWRRPGAGRDEPPRDREEGGAGWRRDGPPSRDRPSFGGDRDRPPPPRDDREEGGAGWRRDGAPPRRDDRDGRDRPGFGDRDRPPPRDDRDRPSFRDDRDRPPPPRDDRDRPPPRRDDDRPSFRRDDDRDRPSFRDDRDRAPIRRDDDRDRPSFRRDDDRDRPPPPRDDRDRLPPRDDRDRPPPRDRDLRDNRDNRDRPPAPRGDDRDRRPPERGWGRDEPRKDSDRAPPARRDSERDSEREKPASAPAPAKEPEEEKPSVDSDGFTTVPKGRRKK